MSTEQQLIELISRKKDTYYRVAFAYVKNKDDALDIVHDTIVKALQKIDQLRHSEYLETWFYRILINESISFVRKNKRFICMDELPEERFTEDETVDRERRIMLFSAIDRLSPQLKTVVILRFFEDMKFDEIAEITATRLSTVKARLYKALKMLKTDIEDARYD